MHHRTNTQTEKQSQSEFATTILPNKHLFGLWAQTHTGSTDELYLCYWIKFKFHCSIIVYIYIKEKTTSWIFSSICHAENMNSSLSSNRELHKWSIIKLIKIWLRLTCCHGNIRVCHTCCFFPLLLLTPTPCFWPLDAVCTCSSNAYFLPFGISRWIPDLCYLIVFHSLLSGFNS